MLTTPVGLCSIFPGKLCKEKEPSWPKCHCSCWNQGNRGHCKLSKEDNMAGGKRTWYQAGSTSENLGAETEPNLQAASDPSNVKADLKVFKAFPEVLHLRTQGERDSHSLYTWWTDADISSSQLLGETETIADGLTDWLGSWFSGTLSGSPGWPETHYTTKDDLDS